MTPPPLNWEDFPGSPKQEDEEDAISTVSAMEDSGYLADIEDEGSDEDEERERNWVCVEQHKSIPACKLVKY